MAFKGKISKRSQRLIAETGGVVGLIFMTWWLKQPEEHVCADIILDSIDHYLAEAGTDKSKLLSAQIGLTDIATWADMNEVWMAWIDPANPPARATVEAPLAAEGLSIEIMVTAAI